MTYKDFNHKIFDFYCSRTKSTFCSLSIDRPELESIINLNELKHFRELKSPWNNLFNECEGIPLYLGLLAIQCYAASIMHEDDNNASDAYQVRLIQLLDLEDNNELQKLFRGLDPENPIQEQIWIDAARYFKKRFNQHLDIPVSTRNAGRYVQYPKSQALLTTEDLKYFTIFFSGEFQMSESIPFNYFKIRLESTLDNLKITNRARNLLRDEIKREKCFRQIYDFFNSWQGEIYEIGTKKKYTTKTKTDFHTGVQSKLILVFSNDLPTLYLLEGRLSNQKEVAWNEMFSLKGYKVFHTGIFLFNEIEYYLNEYEDSRFLYGGMVSYILLNKEARRFEYQFLEKNNKGKIEINEQIVLYKFDADEKVKNTLFRNYFHPEQPVKLVGGLRIGKGRQYLKGHGPLIVGEMPYSLIYRNDRCSYDRETADVGIYKIRVDNSRDIEFEILNYPFGLNCHETRGMGWSLQEYGISNIYDIEGCSIKTSSVAHSTVIRDWIDVNLGKKYEGGNVLLKAIANSRQ